MKPRETHVALTIETKIFLLAKKKTKIFLLGATRT
jgi:hypothetical protein